MWLVRIWVLAYFALVLGALAALWRAGALVELPATAVVIAVLIAVALGVLLLFSSGERRVRG